MWALVSNTFEPGLYVLAGLLEIGRARAHSGNALSRAQPGATPSAEVQEPGREYQRVVFDAIRRLAPLGERDAIDVLRNTEVSSLAASPETEPMWSQEPCSLLGALLQIVAAVEKDLELFDQILQLDGPPDPTLAVSRFRESSRELLSMFREKLEKLDM